MNKREDGVMHFDQDEHRLQDLWNQARLLLKSEIGQEKFASWVKPLALTGADETSVQLSAPNTFSRDWVKENLGRKLSRAWGRVDPQKRAIDVSVGMPAKLVEAAPETSIGSHDVGLNRYRGNAGQFRFDNFIVDPSNEVAYAIAKQIAQGEMGRFNPFYIHGKYGVGKTHLLRAIEAQIATQEPTLRVRFMTAEEFVYGFVSSVRGGDAAGFKQGLRALDLLILDDLQFMAGKGASQDEFFHTLSALTGAGAQIVISADAAPNDLAGLDPRLCSRLCGGLVCDIKPADTHLRRKILQNRVEALASDYPGGMDFPAEALDLMAEQVCSSPRELIGALNMVVSRTLILGRPITMAAVQAILADSLNVRVRKISIADIQRATAAHYGISLDELVMRRRTANIVRPRQVAMYLAKTLTTASLSAIGSRFDKRDHTTVMHAEKKIKAALETDAALRAQISALRHTLTQPQSLA